MCELDKMKLVSKEEVIKILGFSESNFRVLKKKYGWKKIGNRFDLNEIIQSFKGGE